MADPKPNSCVFRPDNESLDILVDLSHDTGISKSEILRRACRFALPKFRSGEIDILRLPIELKPKSRAKAKVAS